MVPLPQWWDENDINVSENCIQSPYHFLPPGMTKRYYQYSETTRPSTKHPDGPDPIELYCNTAMRAGSKMSISIYSK